MASVITQETDTDAEDPEPSAEGSAKPATSKPTTSKPVADHLPAGHCPTSNRTVIDWVKQWSDILEPADVYWCDGSPAEADRLNQQMVDSGAFLRINPEHHPNSFLALSDPRDVARVEEQTYIASATPDEAGPTNNWRDPTELKQELLADFSGAMAGRTMYVIPFCMGPLTSHISQYGIQLTDSPYVVVSMGIMTRMGTQALRHIEADGKFVRCVHSLGAPLAPGETDVAWPCNPDKRSIAHFPETREIWSFGSGYGGNALLGKKCFALRIASVMARDDGWMAEHMLILAVTPPNGKKRYIAAAFPSQCGKTNMAMMDPDMEGWKIETVGDDIAWMRFGDDGQLYAINPESGFFGVAPGTSEATNPNALKALVGNSIFTNVAHIPPSDQELADHIGAHDVWWEDLTDEPPEPLVDWKGQPWSADDGGADDDRKAAHPNARFTVPTTQAPCMAPEWEDPQGVPISAILFGGRRADAVPLVTEARDWEHGVFMAAIMSSETTAAAAGEVGHIRFDPFAMLPFMGYNVGDYISHWLDMGAAGQSAADQSKHLPKMYWVNWFRRDANGRFIWPGFGDNARVVKWIVERLDGTAQAADTPLGLLPEPDSLDLSGIDPELCDQIRTELLSINRDSWMEEIPRLREHLKSLGDRVPRQLFDQLDDLKRRLETA